ncbi:hypothetical protein [Qipengyuania gaetbuli]|uniref:hypothetical protein n=1 Tax=Qipengyuania gaetbuli TaxID=266952 RepID=UPI001CFEB95D|nr:hypothetical protein [Qipengyuania gaetbuli]TNE46672.1 MAG: hypothetical protein EP345_00020 [Sphingomonadales bacterium]
MNESGLTRAEKFWAAAAVIPFLLSIALLGIAISRQTFLAFAIGWPIIQVIGYAGSFKRSGGQIDHPLVKTQVWLHWMMIAMLGLILMRVL